MKLCQDCRWIDDGASCHHPQSGVMVTNYVTGAETMEYPSCHLARTIGTCKPEGLLWVRAFEP